MDKITNGLVVELVRLRKAKRLPWKSMIEWIIQLYGRCWPTELQPAELTLIKTFSAVSGKHRNLVLKRNSEKTMNSQFNVPVPQHQDQHSSVSSWQSQKPAKRQSIIGKEYCQEFRSAIADLCDELRKTNMEVLILKKKCSLLQSRNIRNIHKREKRKVKRLKKQGEVIAKLAAENKQLLFTMRYAQKQLQKNEKKYNTKLKRCRGKFYKTKMRYKSRLRRMKTAPQDNADSNEASNEASDDEEESTIVTMDKGHFNSKIRECCMQLLAHNVGIRNVETCIKAVFDPIGCKADRLPSKSTLANMMVEARAIAQLQIADTVPNYSTNMLHSDGTTKFGEKYGGLQITTPTDTDACSCYTLCLTTMKAGGAADFKELLVNALSDIDSTCQAVGNSTVDISKHILASIKNTMSDRHVVEKKFNELLESYRAEILPDVIEGWNSFTPEQQLSFTCMNNFFCGLHFLVGLADSAAETLKWESLYLDGETTNSESGTLRFIRTACKAIQKQCSQQAGCHIMFKSYLEAQGVSVFPVAKFQGNRFNIVFYNAAGIYYIRNHLTRYLKEIHHTQNRLLKAVLHDLSNSYLTLGCRALGIIGKCITSPLWRLLESPQSMSELGVVYQRIQRLFLKWSVNSTDLMSGRGLADEIDKNDDVFAELLQMNEEEDQDNLVRELLQMLCKSFWLVCGRMLGDHLQDGIFSDMVPATLDRETVNLPKTNVCSERDFALLDRYV